VVLVLGAVGAYAYDDSQKGRIADGVAIGGVDVGGMSAAEAEAAVRAQLVGPLRHPLTVQYSGHSWRLPVGQLKLHADVSAAVQHAIDESRSGGLPGRLVRYVTGGALDKRIAADVSYSQPAVNRFVRRVADALNREPRNADVEPGPASLEVVGATNGRKLRDVLPHAPARRSGAERRCTAHDRGAHALPEAGSHARGGRR
jgi:hypothetical protein